MPKKFANEKHNKKIEEKAKIGTFDLLYNKIIIWLFLPCESGNPARLNALRMAINNFHHLESL